MIAAAVAMMLAGCFEIENDIAFRDDGGARVQVEIALAAEVMAILSNPAFAKAGKSEGFPDLLGACGKPFPTAEPLPDGVRSIESKRGKRGDMETCTIVFDVSDPVRAVESAKKIELKDVDQAPKQDVSLVRLDGASGYRLRVEMTPPKSPEIPPEAAEMAAAMMKAMLANRHVTISVSGERVANTNGEVTPDGRRATWKIPLAAMADPKSRASLTIEADVIYR